MANLFNVFDLDKDGKWNDQEALLFVSWQNNKPDLKDPDNEHGEMVGMTRTLFARLHPEAESAKVDTARVFIDFVLHHGGKRRQSPPMSQSRLQISRSVKRRRKKLARHFVRLGRQTIRSVTRPRTASTRSPKWRLPLR